MTESINKKHLAYLLDKASTLHEKSWKPKTHEYGISLVSATFAATSDKQEAELIHILLSSAWNDSLDWSYRVLSKKEN